jgi:transposase
VDSKDLFALALGLTKPWYVVRNELDTGKRQLEIGIDFERGGTFPCPECGATGCKAYDTEERRWRHLNFFQFETVLSARVPRIDCGRCGKRPVQVPWARPGSGFTLLFEALLLTMVPHMPVAAAARLMGEHDTRLWRVVHHYVDQAVAMRDDSAVERVGVDETSSRRGHNYISIFVDLDVPRVLFATEGKDSSTVARFAEDLAAHGGAPSSIKELCMDMSPAFIKGARESLPSASVTFDKFHITRIIGEAVDKTRREECSEHANLKGGRYALLRNPETMTDEQLGFVSDLLLRKTQLKTARAFHLKLVFQDFYHQPHQKAEAYLKKWCSWASRSRVPAMADAARTIKNHWDGVLRWFTSQITNGLLEGINSLIQAAKAKARGYRTSRNLIAMVTSSPASSNSILPTCNSEEASNVIGGNRRAAPASARGTGCTA